jgi:hypothetical protein
MLVAYGVRLRMLCLQKHFGDMANWFAVSGVIRGSLLMPRGALLRGAHSPFSCLMCALIP